MPDVLDFRVLARGVLVAGVALALVGCGKASTNVRVDGQIVWADGSPARDLAGFVVESTVPGSRVTARGMVDGEGRFRLGTDRPGDGAEPGSHQVAINPVPRFEYEPPPPVTLPERYGRPETSGLTLTAEPGKASRVTLTVSRE